MDKFVTLSLHPRTVELTLDDRSVTLILYPRTTDLTLEERE